MKVKYNELCNYLEDLFVTCKEERNLDSFLSDSEIQYSNKAYVVKYLKKCGYSKEDINSIMS